MEKKYVLWVLISLLSVSLFSQTIVRQVFSPIGASTSVSGNYISQTIGQSTPPGTVSNNKVVLRQGFEQPPKAKPITTAPQTMAINIFPNPNDGAFYLTVETFESVDYTFEIYDGIGKLIMTGDGTGKVEQLINLPHGTGRSIYIIKIRTITGVLGDGKIIVIG